MKEWLPIETLSTRDKKMFVVIAIQADIGTMFAYTSDPYCVWKEGDKFIRWPHDFPPTHYCELPKY